MNKFIRQLLPFASLLLILVALSIRVPDKFLTTDNFLNVLRRSSVNTVIGVGMTAVIISGGIDLSVGSMLALAGMAGAWTMLKFGGEPLSSGAMWVGTLGGVVIGTGCGWLNGSLVTRLRLPPCIVTLGTMSAFRGISYVMNDGQPYNVPGYKYLGGGDFAAVPASVVIALVAVVAASLALRYTPLGRYTYAIGSNR